jgi:hypothetical protein
MPQTNTLPEHSNLISKVSSIKNSSNEISINSYDNEAPIIKQRVNGQSMPNALTRQTSAIVSRVPQSGESVGTKNIRLLSESKVC